MRRLIRVFLLTAFAMASTASVAAAQSATPGPDARDQWWTAWSDCDITSVHTERAPEGGISRMDGMPWLTTKLTGDVDVTLYVWLWTGNRPLPVGDTYPDGKMHTKWLWEFVPDIRDVSVTPTNERGTKGEVEGLQRVLGSSTGGNEYPSSVILPEPGCWTFEVSVTTADGQSARGRIVFPAVP